MVTGCPTRAGFDDCVSETPIPVSDAVANVNPLPTVPWLSVTVSVASYSAAAGAANENPAAVDVSGVSSPSPATTHAYV
jgi:hypothetical protein